MATKTKTTDRTWFSAKAEDRVGEVLIFDEIGFFGVTAKEFARQWKAVGRDVDRFKVKINSPGGDVLEASGVFNIIKAEKKPVDIEIAGFAWSAAGYIAMAGDKVSIAENGNLMIHNPQGGTFGDTQAHKKTIEALETIKTGMSAAYENKSGKSAEEIARIMDEETWYSAQEALDAGFVDEITEPQRMAAHFDANKYIASGRNVPDFVKDAVTAAVLIQPGLIEPVIPAKESVMSEKLTIEALRRDHPELVAQVEREKTETVKAQAVKDERARIMAIRDASFGAHQEALVNTLIENGSNIQDAVIALNKDHKQNGATALSTLENETNKTQIAATGTTETGGPAQISEEQARKELHAQFKASYIQQGMSEEMAEAKAKRAANQ